MNGFSGPPGLWQEARNAEGRVYYYNTQTKVTQWTKPLELMTPAERSLANQPWKEYTAEGGRKYWSNTETKASTWEMPEVYKQALGQAPDSATLPPKPVTPSSAQLGGGFSTSLTRTDEYVDRNDRGFGDRDANGPPRGPTFQRSGPEYNTYEEAEAAFFKMLKQQKVGSDWTWEQTVRATVKDPQYQAVKDPRDRKAAFEKYVTEIRVAEKDRAKERLEKLRADFGKMLRSHSEIQHYTRWKTARPMIEREAIFRSTDDEEERHALFEEYVSDLRRSHVETEVATRKSALDELTAILKGLELEPYTRWSEANEKIRAHPAFAEDAKFSRLSRSDVLTAFENHIKALERSFNDARQREKASRARAERRRRDAFVGLLRELQTQGAIAAGTKWSAIHPSLKDDERYTALLGQPGSTPLDLFRDVVEEEERGLRLLRNDAYDVLEDRRFEVTPSTTLADFERVLSDDRRTRAIPAAARALIFSRLQDKATRRADDDRHAADRATRRQADALRSRIKRLDSPPVRADSTYAGFRERLERLDEFRALDSEELRRQAFDKVVRRLRDKEDDLARRDGPPPPPPSKRSAAPPSGAPPARGSRRGASRSPDREVDAYEADRRRAVADRERQHRRGDPRNPSPPARDRRGDPRRLREYDEADDDRPRSERSERDRERAGRPPPPPSSLPPSSRGPRDELNYDEDGPRGRDRDGERRRRRGSSEESVGSTRKRARRDREDERRRDGERERARDKDKDKDKEREKEKERERERERKEEVAMKSGSEEGEMVEE